MPKILGLLQLICTFHQRLLNEIITNYLNSTFKKILNSDQAGFISRAANKQDHRLKKSHDHLNR